MFSTFLNYTTLITSFSYMGAASNDAVLNHLCYSFSTTILIILVIIDHACVCMVRRELLSTLANDTAALLDAIAASANHTTTEVSNTLMYIYK